MKLKELIRQLRAVEKLNPNIEVGFQSAKWNGVDFQTSRDAHILHIGLDDGECLITIGGVQESADAYKQSLAESEEYDRKFRR